MILNQEQQAAVEYLEGPLLVLAGPGTGKTQLLSAKVAYILEHTDTNAENILCITFTEAGADNMRERLHSMIGQASLDVNIYTYHAFGSQILERYKHYAETFDRQLDAPIDETTQYRIVAEIQQALPVVDILKTANVKDILDVISNAKAARLSASDLHKIAEQNLRDSLELSNNIAPILAGMPPRLKFQAAVEQVYQPILEVLARQSSPEPITGSIERLANSLTRELNELIASEAAKEKPSVSPLTKWRTQCFEAYETSDHQPSYRLKDHIANKKLLSAAHIMQSYDERLRADGLFDFNDMIEQAIHYLKTDRGFRLSLSELFQFILLDEFQDTNPSQFELVKLITDYENPCVMAVGDDDQAIFEFQGANASNLMDFEAYYHAKVITLRKNYRSTGQILGLSRHIADQIQDSFARNYQINKALSAERDFSSVQRLKVERHEFPTTTAEYYWVSQNIRQLVDQGVNPNEIAIIAPQHKYIAPILPYLKQQHLDVTYEKRDNLLNDQKMHELIILAQFINELAHGRPAAHYLMEILSFDFWGIPPTIVINAIEQNAGRAKATLEYLQSIPELAPVSQFFADLVQAAYTAPFELWLDYLTGLLPLREYTSPYLTFYEKTSTEAELLEFYESLATFRQLVLRTLNSRTQATNSIPKLTDFVSVISDYLNAGTAIMRISTYRDNNQSIQVMTAHKSKGLEFEHVFLVSADDASWGKAKGNNNLLVLPRNLIQIRHTGASDEERLRLLFVALTRAKHHLVISNSCCRTDGKELARLRYLDEPSRTDTPISRFLPEDSQTIVSHDQDLSIAEQITTLRLHWTSAYQKLTPELTHSFQDTLEHYRLTATDLTSFIDLIYAGPQQIYRQRLLHAPNDPTTPALYLGNIIHAAFEHVTNQKWDDRQALDYASTEVTKTMLSQHDQSELGEKLAYCLQTALPTFSEILRQANAKAEVNLSHERLNLDGVQITGKIDHLTIHPENKTIEIYDFKTGHYHDGKWNSHSALYKYRLQLGFYKLLLNLSPTYRSYRVTKGHILFVAPDENGQVYDKVYDFETEQRDELELRQLIKAVARAILSLDFTTSPQLNRPADPKNTLSDIKKFVDYLTTKYLDPQDL